MTKQPTTPATEETPALTACQEREIVRVVSRIGKAPARPAYQGARSYTMLPEERA